MHQITKILILLVTISAPVQGQSFAGILDEAGVAREMVLDEQIKTIQFYRQGWIDSYPIITTQEQLPLVVEFDEISSNMSNFSYAVLHCDADWRPSDLTEQEYMEGYFENQINDAEGSFNTYTSYYHYKLILPNNDIRFLVSGNFLLAVYRDYDPEKIVFTRRFLVSEAAVDINADVHRPVLTTYRDNSQEVDVTIRHPGFRIDDPFRETSLSIFQNGIWDYGITRLEPLFINPGELIYDYQEENIFPAGNEFRMFNTRSAQVREYHIAAIDFMDYFHFQLKTDEVNPAHLYFDRDDLNGRFFIEAANTSDPALEADYAFVHFTLKMPFPLADGDVYIAGALTNWQFTDMNKMEYDNEVSAYRGTLFLKQGIHNYRYTYLRHGSNQVDIAEIEGSHFETKNEYLILFYYRGQGDRYDRLVGHQVAYSNEN